MTKFLRSNPFSSKGFLAFVVFIGKTLYAANNYFPNLVSKRTIFPLLLRHKQVWYSCSFYICVFSTLICGGDQMSVCILLNVALRFIMTVVLGLLVDEFDPLDDILDAAML